ncbi:MAG: J domain-containing protein [Armatimonadota bacterium]
MAVTNYYDLLHLPLTASPSQIEAQFRRAMARYRSTVTVDNLQTDPQFQKYLNAYLTLSGSLRAGYTASLKAKTPEKKPPPAPTPLSALTPLDRQMLMVRIAYWRREMADAIHQLRVLLGKEPAYAPAWALLGEIYLTVNRLEEGAQAYENAVLHDDANATYAARLQQIERALDGHGSVSIEASPEEELQREERRKRLGATLIIVLAALGLIAFAFLAPANRLPGGMQIPWRAVGFQAAGTALLLFALGFGRLLQPFERTMVWSSLAAGDRGSIRRYPYALLLLVTAAPSLWLALIALVIFGLMDEDFPGSPFLLILICVLQNAGLAWLMHATHPEALGYTLIFGGNILVIAGMLGWWIGSLGTPTYD